MNVSIAYIPFSLKLFETDKRLRHRLVCQYGLVLLQRSLAYLRVISFRDSVLQERSLELV